MQTSVHLRTSIKTTLAGRNETKVQALVDQYSSRIENLVTVTNRKGKSQQASFDKYIADADDVDGLRLMAARTKVVLNCAGPFAQCVTHGRKHVP